MLCKIYMSSKQKRHCRRLSLIYAKSKVKIDWMFQVSLVKIQFTQFLWQSTQSLKKLSENQPHSQIQALYTCFLCRNFFLFLCLFFRSSLFSNRFLGCFCFLFLCWLSLKNIVRFKIKTKPFNSFCSKQGSRIICLVSSALNCLTELNSTCGDSTEHQFWSFFCRNHSTFYFKHYFLIF